MFWRAGRMMFQYGNTTDVHLAFLGSLRLLIVQSGGYVTLWCLHYVLIICLGVRSPEKRSQILYTYIFITWAKFWLFTYVPVANTTVAISIQCSYSSYHTYFFWGVVSVGLLQKNRQGCTQEWWSLCSKNGRNEMYRTGWYRLSYHYPWFHSFFAYWSLKNSF